MRSCPNCGGGLKFDIASQGLKCGNCSSRFAIGQVPESRAAKADGTLDAMIFTCPQCGGEVFSTSEAAAGFCSFCGASVQLAGRMAAERMPEIVVPFKITKEECGKKFRKHVRNYFFSPGDLSRENAKLEFRGIYMPYWDYTVHQEGQINRHYQDEHRSGDYRIVNHYNFQWDLNEDIDAIQHDASTSFDDEIGLAISPFEPKDSVAFDSAYLEGFYGDVADTQWRDYADFALDEAVDYTESAIRGKTRGRRTDHGPRGNDEFHGKIARSRLAMFPVWFMSYRSGNRVAYSAVNGQTGKVHVDLPVSMGKFFGLTAALTIGLFFLFMMFLTPTPQMDVGFAAFMTIASGIIFTGMSSEIVKRDKASEQEKLGKQQSEAKKFGNKVKRGMGLVSLFAIAMFLVVIVGLTMGLEAIAIVASVWAMGCYLTRHRHLAESNGGSIFPSPLLALISALLGGAVLWYDPVSDLLYYGVTTLALVAAAISLSSLLSLRNMLCTRRMPEFDTHKGGDHRARS